jgi:2'-5' RNA ligase
MDALQLQPSLFPPKPLPPDGPLPARPGPDRHPVFFAILPPPSFEPELRRALADARRWGITAELGPTETRHLSLAALGFAQQLTDNHRAIAAVVASQLTIPAFTLHFNRLASFRAKPGNKRPLVLVPADSTPLTTLTTTLRHAMMEHGLVPQRPPAQFHLTLCYDRTNIRTRDIDPVAFTVDRVTLVRSVYGETRYEHWGEWRLG